MTIIAPLVKLATSH